MLYIGFTGFHFVNNMKDYFMSAMLSIYIVIIGIQLFFSLLRVGTFVGIESIVPQILGVLGTLLFTISDTLLLWNIFLTTIPKSSNISISLYWLGMYIIMISIVRNSKYSFEKHNFAGY